MSYAQAEAAVRETSNELYGRDEYWEWKSFSPDKSVDSNTLLQQINVRKTQNFLK